MDVVILLYLAHVIYNRYVTVLNSGELPGKMFLARMIENDKINAYFWYG